MKTKKIIHFLGLLSMQFLSLPLFAETTECNEITSLPTVITKQGVYCLKKDLSTNISSGVAIEINTNNVAIDFNGFKLGGLGAGSGTKAWGVYANGKSNITLKNGMIRGFFAGFWIIDNAASSGGYLIENNLFDRNTYEGMAISGTGYTIRKNKIIATGGSTEIVSAVGLYASGTGARILENDIHLTYGQEFGQVEGIYVKAAGAIVKGNRITESLNGAFASHGISIFPGEDCLVEGNVIINTSETGSIGIFDLDSGCYCKNNTIVNFSTENFGCFDGGGNSFSP